MKKPNVHQQYICTACRKNAYIAYTASGPNIESLRTKSDWEGKVHIGEWLCIPCCRKRGITFF